MVTVIQPESSVVILIPAKDCHVESGQRKRLGTMVFFPFEGASDKPVIVGRIREPHMRMCRDGEGGQPLL